MTELLEKVFIEAAKLPPEDQNALAAFLLHELVSERRWTQVFAQSQDALAKLADEALAEFTAGRTTPAEEACDLPRH